MMILEMARVRDLKLSNAEDSDGMNYAVAELKIQCEADADFLHSIGAPKALMGGRSKVKSAKIEKPETAMELALYSFRNVKPGGDLPENPVAKKDYDMNIPLASIREWTASRAGGRTTVSVVAFVRHHVEMLADWYTNGHGHAWTGEIKMVKSQKEIDDPGADESDDSDDDPKPPVQGQIKADKTEGSEAVQ